VSAAVDLLRDLLFEVAELKLRLSQMIQMGTVAEIDAGKGYRLDLGVDEAGNRRLSPWIAHPESGGGSSTWMPLTTGQLVMALAPSGDLAAEAALVRAGFGGGNAAPSDDLGETVLLRRGTVRLSARDDRLVLSVGDARIEVTAETIVARAKAVRIEGDGLKHNAKNIGDTHGHVTAPPGPPGPPV
jgi:phage baseplate assembly protein gpV